MHVYWHVRLDVATARKLTEMNQTCDASFADLQLVERRPSVRRVPEPQNRIVYLIRRDSDETAALKLKTWHPSLHEWSSIDPSSKRDCSRSGTVTTQRDLSFAARLQETPSGRARSPSLGGSSAGGASNLGLLGCFRVTSSNPLLRLSAPAPCTLKALQSRPTHWAELQPRSRSIRRRCCSDRL